MPNKNYYYPHGGPPEYVYTSAFCGWRTTTGEEAEQNIEEQKNIAGGAMSADAKTGAAIDELNRMIYMARMAERTFLISHNLKDPGGDWNALIVNFNKILSTEDVFWRNVAILQQVQSGNRKTYEDVSAYFRDKLQKAVYESLVVDVKASTYTILERAVKSAINKMANITDSIDKEGNLKTRRPHKEDIIELKAFSELFGVIETILNADIFQQVNELFSLEKYIDEVRNGILNGNITGQNNTKKLSYTGTGNRGTIAELLYGLVVQGLPYGSNNDHSIAWKVAEHTGSANYKPDRYYATIDVSYNQSVQAIKNNGVNYGNSVRARGIGVMEDLYKKIGDAKGDIVLISDKNYIINEMFKQKGGFTAQDSVSLEALEGLFAKLHIQSINIEALINYLANVGSNLIEPQVDQHILDMIATQIGNFLFDDLHFESIPINANVIHVFMLSGIYVPLSIILEGVWMGLMNINETSLSDYVSVTLKASKGNPRKWRKTETPWIRFREQKEQRNKLNVKFLSGFEDVIVNNVHF